MMVPREKLRSRNGLTLTELLVSVAIMSILFSVIVSGVSSAAKVYRKSVTISDAQTLSSNVISAVENELRYARNIKSSGGIWVFDSDTFGPAVSIVDNGDGRVQVGGYDLLSEGAYPSGLSAEAAVEDYSDGVFTVKVTVTSPLFDPRETTITVRALNH